MSLPNEKELPLAFNEAYYENCKERRLYDDPLLTKDEYWKIWQEMTEHKESRT